MLLLRPPWPDRASTAWRCPDSPRPRLQPGSGTLRPGRPERPWRVWPGQPRTCRPWGRAPAPPPPPGTTGSPSHAGTPEPDPPPRPTHQPPPAPPHHDAHPDQPQYQTQNTPPRVVHPPPDPTGPRRRRTPPPGRTRTRPRGMSPPARRGAGTTKRHRDQEPPRPGTAERTVLTVWQHRGWHSHGAERRAVAGLRRRARYSTGTNHIPNRTQPPAHPVPAPRGTETKRT